MQRDTQIAESKNDLLGVLTMHNNEAIRKKWLTRHTEMHTKAFSNFKALQEVSVGRAEASLTISPRKDSKKDQ